MEAIWGCLSYDIIRWFSICRKINAAAAATSRAPQLASVVRHS